MDNALTKTLEIIFSSERPMPAHFSHNEDRNQSFCINFEPLNKEDDETMSAQVWGVIGDYINNENPLPMRIDQKKFNVILRCAENLMIGAYVITKLGGENFLAELKEKVITNTIESNKFTENKVVQVLSLEKIKEYFDYCLTYGKERAKLSVSAL